MTQPEIQRLFNAWGQSHLHPDAVPPWLINRWEDVTGIEWTSEKIQLMTRNILEELHPNETDVLLEIGCGSGWILKKLKSHCHRVLGLDISRAMLKLARSSLPDDYLLAAEMARLPLKSESADRILCYFVFLNNEDDVYLQQTLEEIYRVLRKGGRALIGQLPDVHGSDSYDRAKTEYVQYCRKHFQLGPDYRRQQRFPIRLFERDQIRRFFLGRGISFHFNDSFNPFFYPGQPATVKWRFDVILNKE